jgi:hypothetical protein
MNEGAMQNTLILAGSGRSGTTWLGNILGANPNVQVIFEPFDSRRVPQAAVLPLRPYARPDGSYPSWELFVRQALLGKVQNEWTTQQGRRWWTTKRLVKEIRANLMLGWLSERFRPRIVFVTRHPCAVVLSRLKLEWDTHLDVFLSQPQLVADYLEPYLPLIREIDGRQNGRQATIQKHAVMWCVENLVPMRQSPHYDWFFCAYEQMYVDPEAEAMRVLRQVGLRHSWFTRRAMYQISNVTRPDSALVGARNPLTDWQQQMTAEDIDTVLELVQAFDIRLYGADAMPDLSAWPVGTAVRQPEAPAIGQRTG